MNPLILRTSVSGQPLGWIDWQDAVLLYVKNQIVWGLGDPPLRFYGGVNRVNNTRSYQDVSPIVAAKGEVQKNQHDKEPPLTNRALFRRDRNTCLYCLTPLADRNLTRDHVMPLSRGGQDVWTNVVTACPSCNQRKADRLIENTNMRLHAVPYAPKYAEWLILRNRHILTDQMTFLKARCPKDRRQFM